MPQLLDWLVLVERELLLFAAFWFLVSAADELAVDGIWVWLWITRRTVERRLPEAADDQPLAFNDTRHIDSRPASSQFRCWRKN